MAATHALDTDDPASAVHACVGFRTDEQRDRVLAAFLREATDAGRRIVYYVDRRPVEDALDFARRAVPGLAPEQLVVRSADATYAGARPFDADEMIATIRSEVDEARRLGFAGVSATGEMSWSIARGVGIDTLCEYETKLSELFADSPIHGLCQYDLRLFASDEFDGVAALHPIVEGATSAPIDAEPDALIRRSAALRGALPLAEAAVFVGAAVANVATGGTLLGLLGIAPFVPASYASVRHTATVAVATVAALLAAVAIGGQLTNTEQLYRVLFVFLSSLLAVAVARGRVQRDRALARMTLVAGVTGMAILPRPPVHVRGVKVAARYVSAFAGAHVGGDFYDVIESNGTVRVVLGDVQGKGLPAVHMAARVAGCFRDASLMGETLLESVTRADRVVSLSAASHEFVTAVALEVFDDGTVDVINCGHLDPIRLPAVGEPHPLPPVQRTSPLGVSPAPTPTRHRLEPGDALVLMTDGFTEARDRAGDMLDPVAALSAIAAVTRRDPDVLAEALTSALDRHADGRATDDAAFLVLQRR